MADKDKTPVQKLEAETGLTRDDLIDRLLVGAYSEGSLPSRDQLLSGTYSQTVVTV